MFSLTSPVVYSVSEDGVSNPPRAFASIPQMALLASTARMTGRKIGRKFTCNRCVPIAYSLESFCFLETHTKHRRVAGTQAPWSWPTGVSSSSVVRTVAMAHRSHLSRFCLHQSVAPLGCTWIGSNVRTPTTSIPSSLSFLAVASLCSTTMR